MKTRRIPPRRERMGEPCPMAEGVLCDVGNASKRVALSLVLDCGCRSCPLYRQIIKEVVNNPWDGFGRSVGYRPDRKEAST